MKEMDALVVDTQELSSHIQTFQRFGFVEMTDVGLNGVHRSTTLAIRVINPYPAEQCIGCVTKNLEVTRVGHVPVVVDPLWPHLRFNQSQWRFARSTGASSSLVIQPLLN